ncbi:uncharacterized protein CLAFUR5_08860 [Fulvia fulva]|uniref:LysM domain-containing protein n=1 Tax=Passalora fulva TaxID=5499 RepID=A0A9Q8PG18_PASFU|nr:uncharacterized protein CLAFUR5_08860 [Fulvia fulva]UJO21831.1 hypothetical protein CLAFUR5_08860 [Fulvia fulva]
MALTGSHLLPLLVVLGSTIAQVCTQRFRGGSMWPEMPGLGPKCVAALNSPVACPEFLVDWSVPGATPSFDHLNVLCTNECLDSLKSAQKHIEESCTADTEVILSEGTTYPAIWVVDRYLYIFSTACLKSFSGQFCHSKSAATTTPTGSPEEVECSSCALGSMSLQLSSPFGFSNASAEAFETLLTRCGVSNYTFDPPRQYALDLPAKTNMKATASPVKQCTALYTIQEGDTCNSIAFAHDVSTVNLINANNLDYTCTLLHFRKSLCIPETCDVYKA